MFPRVFLALFLLFTAGSAAYGQTITRVTQSRSDSANETRAISLLRRLDVQVLHYRSLGEFEADGRLARVSLSAFEREFAAINVEVESLLSQFPNTKLKHAITNALASYRDGAFWWRKIDQPRVVHVSGLTSSAFSRSQPDAVLLSTVPYTVAIHWRQARKYLTQAENLISR